MATCLVMRLLPAPDDLFSELNVDGRESKVVNELLKDLFEISLKLPPEVDKVSSCVA